MILHSLIIEILVALVMLAIVVFSWHLGRREGLRAERGWSQILAGFVLLLLGALIDISDHFPALSRFVVLGQTPYQSLAEKVLGFLGGFLLLAVGLWRWLPLLADRRRAEEELREAHRELEERARRDSDELALRTLDLEREIRERRQATQALKWSEEILQTVLSNAPIVLLATDPGGRITLAKGSALPSVGLEPAEMVGRSAFEAFRRDPESIAGLERALAGEPVSAVVEMGDRVFQFQHTAWHREDGSPAGVITVAMDVTERERTRRELRLAKEAAEEANRAKSRFLANMSHELRTPLNSIIGFGNILAKNREDRLSTQELRYLERIRDNGRHLLDLINEILDLSRIEAGRVTLDLRAVALGELIDETLAQIVSAAPEEQVRLVTELPARSTPVFTDPVRLKQVLINLVSNAFKFTVEGQVTVRLEVDEETAAPRRIAVTDTGIGIQSDQLATIFEAFQQVDTSAARRHGGTGLGLAISSSLCRLLGYRLEVESEPGAGSTFSVVLASGDPASGDPASGVPANFAVSSAPAPAPHGREPLPSDLGQLAGKRVLVIDDSADARLLLMQYLEDLGCRPLAAASGEEGLHLARQERPHLITLDLMMPEVNGWQVLADLKRDPELAEIPVVVVSIVAEEERGTLLGAVEALNKPVEREELMEVLRRSLPSRPEEVLVVDDDEDQRLLLAGLLGEQGIRVRTAAGGREALAQLERSRPDLVLLDLGMPEMDGASLLSFIRTDPRLRRLPVVIVTGKELTAEEIRDLKRNAAAILLKDSRLRDELHHFLSGFGRHADPNAWKISRPITGEA